MLRGSSIEGIRRVDLGVKPPAAFDIEASFSQGGTKQRRRRISSATEQPPSRAEAQARRYYRSCRTSISSVSRGLSLRAGRGSRAWSQFGGACTLDVLARRDVCGVMTPASKWICSSPPQVQLLQTCVLCFLFLDVFPYLFLVPSDPGHRSCDTCRSIRRTSVQL